MDQVTDIGFKSFFSLQMKVPYWNVKRSIKNGLLEEWQKDVIGTH